MVYLTNHWPINTEDGFIYGAADTMFEIKTHGDINVTTKRKTNATLGNGTLDQNQDTIN
jgi:hypothetical protein